MRHSLTTYLDRLLERSGALFRSSKQYIEYDQHGKDMQGFDAKENASKELLSTDGYRPLSVLSWSRPDRSGARAHIAVRKISGLSTYPEVEEIMLATSPSPRIGATFSQIKSFCATAIQSDFYMEGGDVKLNKELRNSLKILMTSKVPFNRIDPEKPLRVAAFTGWVVTNVHRPDEIEAFTDDVAHIVRKNWDETQTTTH